MSYLSAGEARISEAFRIIAIVTIPEWKWDMIAMDFVSGLPRTSSGYDAIWVIIDRLTKIAYFLPIKKMYSTNRLARLYANRIVYLHRVP